jgi:hypothetical protein
MIITANFSALARTRWYEYVSRFVFGGAITALAGIVAKQYGPSIGGLFLAFPAIFPASATLIEKHEKEKKRQAGGHVTLRGRKAAALDAAGASMGALGLLIFAFLVWRLIVHLSSWAALLSATLGWLAVSILAWNLRRVC